MFYIIISAVHVSGGFSAHHQELIKTVCTALGIVMLSCCLPLVWMSWKLEVGSSSKQIVALYGNFMNRQNVTK